MSDEPTPTEMPAGWYPHPEMAQTLRYWDGENWTESTAPAPAAVTAAPASSGPGVFTIARGVALGLIIVIVAIYFIYENTKETRFDCLMDNIDRLETGEPQRICPDD